MKSLLLLSLLGGCFYIDPINQRPSLEIENTSASQIDRGDPVSLVARVSDPEGHIVRLQWRVFACDDATVLSTCDQSPADEGQLQDFSFVAPVARDGGSPAQSLLVELEGTDDLGAVARPSQQLIIPLGNSEPKVTTSHQSNYGNTIGLPIDVFAVYGDLDDTAANVTMTYQLFPPTASAVTPTPVCPLLPGGVCPQPEDETLLQDGIRFVPDVIGEWQVRVTATDPLGDPDGATSVFETIVVVVDQLPCLGVVSPAPPPPSSVLPISEPTLFQVFQVVDSIDPYPSNVNDPNLGQSEFHWSMKVNSGARQTLPTETGNGVALDPASFAPGDVVELRVEIADRLSPFPLTCNSGDATCELDPTLTPSCLQRQTWKVVVQ